jgi:uncharacterized protein YmfQ (DUF2313 family)
MTIQSVVDELNGKLPIALDAVEAKYEFVSEDDPRLDMQLLLRWDNNVTIHDGIMMVIGTIKRSRLVLTPFTLIGENLIHTFVSTKSLETLPVAPV